MENDILKSSSAVQWQLEISSTEYQCPQYFNRDPSPGQEHQRFIVSCLRSENVENDSIRKLMDFLPC